MLLFSIQITTDLQLANNGQQEPGSTVLVAGATGGVGQLATAKLLERGYKVRALSRKPETTKQLFSNHPNLEVCCAWAAVGGTTFSGSNMVWEGDNGPRPTDFDGPRNLIAACPKSLRRFVFVTSAGVERQKELPWAILNTFGVLKFKRESEQFLQSSGLPYTILRPSRLTDGPYTSYDLNTLLQATSGSKQEVQLAAGDCLFGEASRIAVAAVAVALLGVVAAELLWRRRCYDVHKIPVAPDSVPILGHLLLYWRHKDFSKWFLSFHETTQQPVLRVNVLHKLFVVVADPQLAAAVYARTGEDRVPRKVPEYGAFDAATGLYGHHSILTEQNEEMWVAVRKALSPAYTPAANKQNYNAVLKSYGDVGRRIAAAIKKQQHQTAEAGSTGADITEGCNLVPGSVAPAGVNVSISVKRAAAADVPVDLHLLGAAIQTQVEGLFEMPQKDIDYLQVAHDIETAISIVHNHPAQPWLKVLHLKFPWASQQGKQLHEARLRLSSKCYEPIYEHVKSCVAPSDLSLTACLRRLINPHTGKPPCRERILAEIGNQIMAPETAAHTISWVLYCLATHPEAEAKLLAELKQAGLPCNGDLEAAVGVLSQSFDPLKGLPFLEGVVSEAMRLYPAGASASPRLTEKPTRVGPYRLPAGVTIFPSLFAINNWSRTWGEDAREFKPERWEAPNAALDEQTGAPRFLPFSSGPKNCIGLALGQVAVRSAVALLMSTFRFKPAARMGNGHADVMQRTMLALTLKVEGGMWLNASYRTASTP
eukprot:gene5921-6161_t